jgi:Kdo2-lipid IVA lauroyltransferase/acyltransferase
MKGGRRAGPGEALARIGLAALSPAGLVLAWLPGRLGLWLGRRLGDLAWLALPGRRAVVRANLTRAFGGEMTAAELGRLCRRSFEHLGMNLVEACMFYFRPPSRLLSRVEFRGVEHLDAAGAGGRGMVLLTAHLGNWELLAASHVLCGWPLSVMVRPLDSPLLDGIVERLRLRSGVELIAKRRGFQDALDALRRGRMVGILLDQNASRREGVFVPFFGTPASTSRGLALIALRSGAPVLPAFIRRLPGGRHVVEVGPCIAAPAGRDVVAYTAAFNRALEAAIRRAPEQWFWMHRRWKTRPAEEAA